MPGILNLDEVLVERTEIQKTISGQVRTWSLRDDIPVEVMLRVFRLMGNARQNATAVQKVDVETPAGAGDDQVDEIFTAITVMQQSLETYIDEALDVCLGIWQHSYPETTREELRAWFTHEERERIVQLFFSRRLAASRQLSSATTPEPTTPTAEQGQEQQTAPNRAARRSSSRSSRGGIPSQKRLSRQLKGAGL